MGTFPFIAEGDFIEAEGKMTVHPVYGEQMQVTSYEIKEPGDIIGIEKYLSSGAIKGIGPGLAAKIIKKFGEDAIRVIEEQPERLAEIKGISERMAMEISAQVEEKKDMRAAMLFLAGYGISMRMALRIYKFYGTAVYSIIEKNPYQLADDIDGIGFRIADEIAHRAGFRADSEYRTRCGILYVLSQAGANGHMYLPKDELIGNCSMLLGDEAGSIGDILDNMQFDKRIIIKDNNVFNASAYYTELSIARLLYEINAIVPIQVITGGPGTGKTTNIRRFIEKYESEGLEIACAAPTGRAAKRMEEATGHQASTIHRLLEVTPVGMMESGEGSGSEYDGHEKVRFARNESCPLEYDVIIIDEMSMVDAYLMNSLLKAVVPGTKLILVGDMNQLPSVGPGNVLKDIIYSDCFDVMKLTKIYRQDESSDIIINAHRIIDGEHIDLDKHSRDFVFVKRHEAERAIAAMITLVKEKLPKYIDADIEDIQVMSPMKKGALGVERLNMILQEHLNPQASHKSQKEIAGVIWREGDKVMQIRNNYNIEWEIRDDGGSVMRHGTGIYNGDIGIIREINNFAEEIEVEYDEGRIATYGFTDMDELELAYAITVHKSQGSEYPAVVIPVCQGPRMLMTRNLIYTAVTRAQKCVTLVGIPECFDEMCSNTQEMKRYSGLRERIVEIFI
ncbi:MAG: AAA family ATPase [Lachnospiraceae bacterium]|nr:AAA family ATPase [Lachnospiraceae bacterium]